MGSKFHTFIYNLLHFVFISFWHLLTNFFFTGNNTILQTQGGVHLKLNQRICICAINLWLIACFSGSILNILICGLLHVYATAETVKLVHVAYCIFATNYAIISLKLLFLFDMINSYIERFILLRQAVLMEFPNRIQVTCCVISMSWK